MTDDPFRCICPHVQNPDAPIELIDGIPRAVEGCPAHVYRYAFQRKADELWPRAGSSRLTSGDTPMTVPRHSCPNGPHRAPEGPNEDLAQCPTCWSPTYAMRPEGETYGEHLPNCSLPLRHESYCKPGGEGHQRASAIRGYWPTSGDTPT